MVFCGITRQEFENEAEDIEIWLDGDGVSITARPRFYPSGSLGWFAGGRARVQVGGRTVVVQVTMNLTIVGSKQLPS